jgi:osomolarity two-component system, sensor histidine kinase NIK1
MSTETAIHPFLSHLVALLSIYELQPTATSTSSNTSQATPGRTPGIPLPRYDGPRSETTNAIERSLNIITGRMKRAEEKLGWVHPWLSVNSGFDSNELTPTNGNLTFSDGFGSPAAKALNGSNSSTQTAEVDPFAMAIHAPTPIIHSPVMSSQGGGKHPRAPSPMSISLQGINNVNSARTPSSSSHTGPLSPLTYPCPTCRRPLIKSSSTPMSPQHNTHHSSAVLPSPNGSPLVVPPGPLSTAAFESGLSAVEELHLLKAQVQDVARVCKAVADGDLTQKIEVGVQGPVMVQLKDVINTMVDKLGQFAKEVTRVSLEVGTEGRLGGQAVVVGVQGKWQELTDVVNRLAANLSTQVRSIAIVTTAVARGDLSQMIEVDAKGEILALKVCVCV